MGEAGSSDVVVQAPAPAAVKVLAVSRIAPSLKDEGRLKLSFFDTPWVGLPPVQQVYLYHLDDDNDTDDGYFPAIVSRIKTALAETLAHYLPLAGTLEHVPDTGDLVVDWSGSDVGVAFVEADAAAGMDVRRLAGDETHDLAAFLSLVPELNTGVLPAPLLSVQVTRLGAGLAVGMSMHHAIVDGRGAWRFIEAWSSASRVGSPVTEALGPPHYGRDVVSHPRGGDELARVLLKIVAPNLPVVTKGVRDTSQRFRLARRTFYLGEDDIRALRRRIDDLAQAEGDTPEPKKPVSTFVALSALVWSAFVRSKGLGVGGANKEEDTYLMFHADLRARLDPPVSDAYLGNCVRPCVARCADAAKIAGEAGILHAARAVQAAVAEMAAAPLTGTDESGFDTVRQLPFSRVANVAASPRYKAYEATDFGFGMPARVEMVSMNHDGEMMLVGGRREGEVQVSVSIDPAHMDALKACILGTSK
uniref:Uncharacterized protein n=1 Tax=Avena sativa TaxID=4498 RepID=A0ACD5ZQ84_AVESA